jgi:hypothetical protein
MKIEFSSYNKVLSEKEKSPGLRSARGEYGQGVIPGTNILNHEKMGYADINAL